MQAKRPADAVPVLRALYEQRAVSPGPQHRDAREVFLDLYDALAGSDQLAAAVTLTEEHLAAVRRKAGDKDRQTLLAMNKLALAYQAAKQPELAVPLAEQAAALSSEL